MNEVKLAIWMGLSGWMIGEASATPSVYQCPFVADPRMLLMPGEYCGRGSFLHYWSCCEDNLFQCCFHFETWTIVIFALICIGALAGMIFWVMRALLQSGSN
ncbi:unnamed protein product, partial [Mesorhabditis belari]|uniref:Uncharacterized protein n=1 Tax=Mesorhabditis belari TaxID=2138241 RepID=A0AAF3J225_9BILA